MRVLLLTPFNPDPASAERHLARYGGVERYAWHLVQELAALGHSVTVVTSDVKGSRVADGPVTIRTVPRIAVPYGAAIFNWIPAILGDDPDVVHVQGTYPLLTEWAPVLCRIRGLPSVLTYHFDIVGRSPVQRSLASAFYAIFRRTVGLYDRGIFLSPGYLDSGPVARGVRRDRVRFGTVGVETGRFRPLPIPRRGRTILFVGRLARFKGLDVLLEVHKRLEGWELVIVGEGEMGDHLRMRIAREGLRVDLRGHVTDEELVRLYNEATATVLPSTDRQENVGTVLMESLCCGTPAVASDLPGLRYVAEFGGALVPPSDREALAAAIRAFDAQPWSEAKRQDVAARAAARFSWKKVVQDVLEVYEEAVRAARALR